MSAHEHHDGGCKTEIKDKACETVCIEPGLFGVMVLKARNHV